MTVQTHKMTALVTGASAGIGEALAVELAKQKFELILVARRLDRLDTLAQRLTAEHGVTVHTIAADLSVSGASEKLHADVAAAGVAGMLAGKPTVVPGINNKAVVLSTKLAPRALNSRITQWINGKTH